MPNVYISSSCLRTSALSLLSLVLPAKAQELDNGACESSFIRTEVPCEGQFKPGDQATVLSNNLQCGPLPSAAASHVMSGTVTARLPEKFTFSDCKGLYRGQVALQHWTAESPSGTTNLWNFREPLTGINCFARVEDRFNQRFGVNIEPPEFRISQSPIFSLGQLKIDSPSAKVAAGCVSEFGFGPVVEIELKAVQAGFGLQIMPPTNDIRPNFQATLGIMQMSADLRLNLPTVGNTITEYSKKVVYGPGISMKLGENEAGLHRGWIGVESSISTRQMSPIYTDSCPRMLNELRLPTVENRSLRNETKNF